MLEETIYGPFLDEELFYYHDRTDLELKGLEIYDADQGFVGFDDLEKTHDLGKRGSFENVMFSGQVTLRKTTCLSENGFKLLLKDARKQDPTVGPETLHKACKQGQVTVELHCQLALMPVCYLTKRPPHSVLIYSKNQNNLTYQRRYIVRTFHITCFRRSELTIQRYMVLKFIIDACNRNRYEVPREDRDVHWLVKVYIEDYAAAFKKHERPRLHRSEVYDHFATHAEWLKKIFSAKVLVDNGKWFDWIEGSKRWKKKAKKDGLVWGVPMARPILPRAGSRNQRRRSFSLDSHPDYAMGPEDFEIDMDIPSSDPGQTSSESDESSSQSDEGDGEVHYAHDPRLRSLVHRGLLQPMPVPTWYWACNIKAGCPFVIDIGHQRTPEAPCMAPLSDKQKNYLMHSVWGLYDAKLGKVWRKMCQAHMDWHWKEAGLVLDHQRRRIYEVKEVRNDA